MDVGQKMEDADSSVQTAVLCSGCVYFRYMFSMRPVGEPHPFCVGETHGMAYVSWQG